MMRLKERKSMEEGKRERENDRKEREGGETRACVCERGIERVCVCVPVCVYCLE